MDRNDRDEARREHIRSEQRREERKANEAYDARHQKIDRGFLELDAADREVERARSQVHDSCVSQAVRDIDMCETDIDGLLSKLKTLPDEPDRHWPKIPGKLFSLLHPGSNADISRKAQEWSERFSDIRLTPRTETKVTMERIRKLQADVQGYRDRPSSFKAGFFTVPISADAIDLLRELGSKLRWLDQYYLELDTANLRHSLKLD